MRIAIISDTHGYFDPQLKTLLSGADLILHAGDVGSKEVLDELGHIAPVHAVRGNVDPPELNLPPLLHLDIGGLHVEMIHILPVPQSELEVWAERALLPDGKLPRRSEAFLKTLDDRTDAVVFGHSHEPCLVALGRRLFFNPGSAGKKRFDLPRCFGVLEILPGVIRASIQGLERPTGGLPARIQMEFES